MKKVSEVHVHCVMGNSLLFNPLVPDDFNLHAV
jgi:hypothetical protein